MKQKIFLKNSRNGNKLSFVTPAPGPVNLNEMIRKRKKKNNSPAWGVQVREKI